MMRFVLAVVGAVSAATFSHANDASFLRVKAARAGAALHGNMPTIEDVCTMRSTYVDHALTANTA